MVLFFETVYTQFHLDEIFILSFFINYLSCHQIILYCSSFIENETPIGSSLIPYPSVVKCLMFDFLTSTLITCLIQHI
jgi:hypothetical protein